MKSERPAGRSGIGGWVFLVVVLVIYTVTALVDYELVLSAIGVFTQLLDKMLPALALVFVLIFVVDLLLDPKRVEKYLGRRSGILGWLAAIVVGILSTGPVYAWYALLHDLGQKGMKTSLVAVVLYSRAVKLPLLPLLVHYFSLGYTMVLAFYLIGFSIIGGLLMERIEGMHAVSD
ncbi:MAG: permease [Pseudomonadota bacterium]|nr:permease [Pseudomonadota bacterium]